MPHPLHRRAVLAITAGLACLPTLGAALTYPGAAPCAGTLQACIDGAASGDEIELAFSTSNGESLDIRKSVTLRPAAGHTPTIAYAMAYASTSTIEVTLQSLKVTSSVLGLVGPGGGNLRLRVERNTFAPSSNSAIELRTTSGPGVYGGFIATLEGNTIAVSGSDTCADAILVSLGKPGEGPSEVVALDNDISVTNLGQCAGISIYQSDGRLGVTLERNRIHGSQFANGIVVRSGGGALDAGIFNNLVHGQAGHVGAPGAIVVYADGPGDVTAALVNNTVAHNETGMWASARTDLGGRVRGAMRNNIVAFNTRSGLNYAPDLAPDFTESHNLLYGNGAPETDLPADPFRRTGDPAFANAAGGDYRLTGASDAINRGDNGALPPSSTQDLAGAARIGGGVIDIGAYEYPREIVVEPPAPTVTSVPTLGEWALLVLAAAMLLAARVGLRGRP